MCPASTTIINSSCPHVFLASCMPQGGDGTDRHHATPDHMATVCTRCGSKDYTRSRAVARMVGSVLFACRDTWWRSTSGAAGTSPASSRPANAPSSSRRTLTLSRFR
ncbi:hypothetical protein ZWY2020_004905 [Hordeum vulgare]|nr:hypothetical protein ZWY2020_004905 [Hordeum vulgare]